MAFYTISGILTRIQSVIFPNGSKKITASAHQQLLKDIIDATSIGLYSTSRNYGSGASWCIHDAGDGYKIFRCTTNTTGVFNPSHWSAIADYDTDISDIQSDISNIQSDISDIQSDVSGIYTQLLFQSPAITVSAAEISSLDATAKIIFPYSGGDYIVPLGFLVRYQYGTNDYSSDPIRVSIDGLDGYLAEFTISAPGNIEFFLPSSYANMDVSSISPGLPVVVYAPSPPSGGDGQFVISTLYRICTF